MFLCGNASGDRKLKLFVIGKYKKPRAFKNLVHLPVIYEVQSNAWTTAKTFRNFFPQHFVPDVKNNLERFGLPKDAKTLLLLDNCRAHPPNFEVKLGNISVRYLLPNVTPLVQPME